MKLLKEKLKGKTILIIDDEESTRKLLINYFSKLGYEMLEAATGQAGKKQYLKHDPCFIILDIQLPDIDGKKICTWLRKDINSNVPIIILSAISSENDRIDGLKLGADDYVAKPFNPEELAVRVETVLRRTANRCSKISYRSLTLKPLMGNAKYQDAILDLTAFEYKLLYVFMTHPDQILTREQLINLVYKKEEKIIHERTVDVHIKNLREKLGCFTDFPFIQTVRGIGYKFTAS